MKVGDLTYDGTTYKLVEPTIGDLRAIGSVQATPRAYHHWQRRPK